MYSQPPCYFHWIGKSHAQGNHEDITTNLNTYNLTEEFYVKKTGAEIKKKSTSLSWINHKNNRWAWKSIWASSCEVFIRYQGTLPQNDFSRTWLHLPRIIYIKFLNKTMQIIYRKMAELFYGISAKKDNATEELITFYKILFKTLKI